MVNVASHFTYALSLNTTYIYTFFDLWILYLSFFILSEPQE